MSRPYDFSSMTALICFEAAARNQGFKAAATELNVTPAAISHQIKALEADLGCSLFRRLHRGVQLTEKGAFLLVALRRGFEGISEAVEQLRIHPEHVDVTIHATTAVSALWLTPKMTAFWKLHPQVTISQIVSDLPDVSGAGDISIGYGLPDDKPGAVRDLFRDRVLALGTPQFASDYNVSKAADLLDLPLIHQYSDQTGWTGWSEWFQELGLGTPRGRSFAVNNHMIALQAAEDHVGAVLGWEGLIGGLIASGRLVPLTPETVPSPITFQIRIHPRASAHARLFANWLLQNSAPQVTPHTEQS
jgi:LysR family transcriptional regulator, glycine cleavage system transcriptional activator